MQNGLKKWMDGWVGGVQKESLEPKPQTFKKPKTSAPKKKVVKVKKPCPFFGDYHPPKRITPSRFVTPKLYKFLESNLKLKFGLEARNQAEEFVSRLCERVSLTVKRKSKYHQFVFAIRDDMVSLGLIKTQNEFHWFIEDYLPDSFRIKAIPCYGSSKGPILDVDDFDEDLSGK